MNKLRTISRYFINALLAAVLLSSCRGEKTVYVWNMKDVIGLWILAIVVVVMLVLLAYAWIADKVDAWRRKRKRS